MFSNKVGITGRVKAKVYDENGFIKRYERTLFDRILNRPGRKMIAINPHNGKAVVGVVADAGPAKFTGKHFGGSPEVMTHLNLIYGKKKGKVILYFVDDPNDEIPLGPVRSHHEIASSIKES